LASRAEALARRASPLASRAGTLARRASPLASRAEALARRAGPLASRAEALARPIGALRGPNPLHHGVHHAVAPRQVEAERRRERRLDARDQRVLQPPAGAEQARLHRLLGDAEALRRLRAGHPLDRA